MTNPSDKRQMPDRRKQPRGGRRPDDPDGFAPLVLVAYDDVGARETCETILAKLHFAVAPVDSVEKALSVIPTLRPDVVVAHVHDITLLRHAAAGIPLVEVTEAMRSPDVLVEAIRRALRAAQTRES